MIRQPTVFVLGAGASKPYGFPLGNEIKQMILAELSTDLGKEHYRACGFDNQQVEEFITVLTASPYDTIDTILTARASLKDIGRFAIASVLAPCERQNSLFPPKDWYKHIYHRLQLDDPRAPAPPLSIVTFNYDGSLEYYLHRTVETALEGALLQSAKEKLAEIPIIHVHGQLGAYPQLRYGFYEDRILVRRAARTIRIVSDPELEKADEFVRAFHLMNGAVNILFLGFGFDEQNMNRLRLRELPDGKKIMGTSLRLKNRIWVENYFGGSITLADDKILVLLRKIENIV